MELACERFAGAEPGPHVLITGGVHGDEYEPMAALRRLIAELREHPPRRGRVTLVPVVNEAAFRCASRVADDGLDLARTCPGREDGSVTERTAFALSQLLRTADYYLDLHTGGTRLRVLPLAGYMLHANPEILETQRHMARLFGLPLVWGTDASFHGRSLSVARDANIPAIYAEYGGGGGCDPAGVQAYVASCRNLLIGLGVMAGTVWEPPAPWVVEDRSPGSGHMQWSHPAPREGYFEAVMALGQSVSRGEVLGRIVDVLGRSEETIVAASSGIVVVLRCDGPVTIGDGLAVVVTPQARAVSRER